MAARLPGERAFGIAGLWRDWLGCRDPEVARIFLTLAPAESMAAEPAPLQPRARKGSTDSPAQPAGKTKVA